MQPACARRRRATLTYGERPGGVYLYLAARGPRYLYLVLVTRLYLSALR